VPDDDDETARANAARQLNVLGVDPAEARLGALGRRLGLPSRRKAA
jgi:hypothetical protein